MPFQKGNTHGFKKGNQLQKRRPPHNRISRDLKEGIVDAAIAVGRDGNGTDGLAGYLEMCAKKYPKQYISLLSRVLPLQITTNTGAFIGEVNIVSVPPDRFLSSEDVKRLQSPIIDVTPEKKEDAA